MPIKNKIHYPLIMLLLCDELAAHALGCYGNSVCRTPNLDRLAACSVRFEFCYVQSPMCTPSRVSIATARYPRSHGALDNSCRPLDDELSLYEVVRQAGYQTVLIGKSHFGLSPLEFGFTEAESVSTPGISTFGIADPAERQRAGYKRLPGNLPLVIYGRYPRSADQTDSALISARVVQRIHAMARPGSGAGAKPLFLCASFLAPHTPLLPPSPFDELYSPESVDIPPNFCASLKGKPLVQRFYYESRGFSRLQEDDYRRARAAYYATISHLDLEIGRIIDVLEENGLLEETILIFTADHGSMMGEHGWIEKWGHFYEQVVRVPLLIHIPGLPSNGRVERSLVESIDILPTILDAAGLEIPPKAQGRSLMPLLRGEASLHRTDVFSEWFAGGLLTSPCVMIRGGRYKMCLYPDQASIEKRLPLDHLARFTDVFDSPAIDGELYDLESDPWELNNRWDDPSFADIQRQLADRITAWSKAQKHHVDWSACTPTGRSAWANFRLEEGALARALEELTTPAVRVQLPRVASR